LSNERDRIVEVELSFARVAKCRVWVLVVAAVAFALACGGSHGSGATQSSVAIPAKSVSSAQMQYLADGKVTLAEYQEAFASFEACVTKQGGRIRVTSRDPASGAILYETGAETGTPTAPNLASPEGRCYGEYFGKVEVAFQSTDPAFLASLRQQQIQIYLTSVKPCLQKNGVAAPATVEPGSDEFVKLGDQAYKFVTQGKCPS
jgi:hypothetical protein